ncbi:MAG: ATP-binding cassette domain-containing protein [Fibromonadaceae bacterium]|jgi:excinuclease ABC subunit A|nr:ATP-binding cassette domain-containing protein [Fibromonadaceae bacterium]
MEGQRQNLDIVISGARKHNLKNISLSIPRHKLTVITGVSGAGKSSLAFDTLFAEGQRRFLECLSTYARRFLGKIDRGGVDSIQGLAPAIAVDQRSTSKSPRSTVATLTEIYDYFRIMWARIGIPHCPVHGKAVQRHNTAELLQYLYSNFENNNKNLVEVYSRDEILDRVPLTEKNKTRLLDSIEKAFEEGKGKIKIKVENKIANYSNFLCCPDCNFSLTKELDPKNFSFNSHFGACERCQGIGFIFEKLCPECKGERLKSEYLAVKIDGKSISDACKLSISEAYDWLGNISFDEIQKNIAAPLLKEILGRMEFIINVGIPYLSLNRRGDSLSGGEAQRLRLASQIGSGLEGVLYVLDEPTIGLHQSDTQKLLDSLYRLRDLGNTIVVVEHDLEFIRASDYIIDLGPKAGELGGEIVAIGTPEELSKLKAIEKFPDSATIQFLTGTKALTDVAVEAKRVPLQAASCSHTYFFTLNNLRKNNLKNISVQIPFGAITAISGVSGSGKSTLMECIQEEAVKKEEPVCFIDQTPINSSPRSTPVSYMGILEKFRDLFAKLPESKIRGYDAGRFAYNKEGGRCDVCEGRGYQLIEMHFLSDVWELCEACKGKRYNNETLSVFWKGKNIADILDMRVKFACEFFKDIKKIAKPLQVLESLGLGYLRLGQATTTMSGGEIQRLKLATEFYKSSHSSAIFLLDEPTTGLHLQDIQPLWNHLRNLANTGHAVVFVEHHPDMVRLADYVIELGPEGGDKGGYLQLLISQNILEQQVP